MESMLIISYGALLNGVDNFEMQSWCIVERAMNVYIHVGQ